MLALAVQVLYSGFRVMLRPRQKPEDLKDTYRLWIGFLKLSPQYREYCQARQGEEDYSVDDVYEDFLRRNFSPINNRPVLDFGTIERDYRCFGDIFSSEFDFEEWWETKMCVLLKRIWEGTVGVRTFHQDIRSHVRRIARRLRATLDNQTGVPTEENIMKAIQGTIGAHRWALSLTVLACYPTDILIGHLKKVINAYKKQHNITRADQKKFIREVMPFPFPRYIPPTDVPAYEMYLKVLERRGTQKPHMKWKAIIQELEPLAIEEDGAIIEKIRLEFVKNGRKAKRLLRNVSNGIFPGRVSKREKNRP